MFFSSTRSLLSRAMLPLASALQGQGSSENEPPDHPELPTPTQSPLTYGKVFLALPRVTNCKTPEINSKIANLWNLPPVTDSKKFKASYQEGRDVLR